MIYSRIPERRVPGKRLGRHIRHDPRSLRFQVPEADPATLTSVRHQRYIPVLDQGDLGSCTGNASVGALGTGALFTLVVRGRLSQTDADADEKQAISLYSAATSLDDYDGEYPPEDTGSDGLSVAKAAQRAGLISGYRHATSLEAALAALAQQPVIAGINWYSSFDQPSSKTGRIYLRSDAYVRGGHEICLDELDVENKLIGFTNSWGSSWGLEGRAFISWDDFGRLLEEDGDVTAFVPVTEPAPQPTPDPTGCLGQFAAEIKAVLKKYGF